MALGNILRTRREELQLTLEEVSRSAGCSKPYLSTIETGKVKNPPSDGLLKNLERALNFSSGELLRMAHHQSLPPDIRHEYEAVEAENLKWRQFVRRLVHHEGSPDLGALLAEGELDIERIPQAVRAGRLIPVINRVAAGYPRDFQDLDYPVGIADDYIRCPDVHDANAFAVRVVGDSMETKFVEGDVVVFSPAAEVRNGDDCFIRFSDPHETTFKRVFFESDQKLRLQPRNAKYPPLMVDAKRINGLYRAVMKIEEL